MKSKDLQKAVRTKHENEDGPSKIHRDLGGVVSKRTINLWIKIRQVLSNSRILPAVHAQLAQKSTSQRQNDVLITINRYQQED